LQQRGDDRADEVVDGEIARTEGALDGTAEHVQREHVEQDVRDAAMHERTGDDLPHPEQAGAERPQREIHHQKLAHHLLQQEHRHVGNQQVACDGRQVERHQASSVKSGTA
jgi:hypothetical protein